MYKKRIIISMWAICLYMMFSTIVAFVRYKSVKITEKINCDWEIIMTCWEYWCEDLCYPQYIDITFLTPNKNN